MLEALEEQELEESEPITDEEVRGWISRDPITRYRRWLVATDNATEAELDEARTLWQQRYRQQAENPS